MSNTRKLNDPSKWGPSFWFTFHMSATAYPNTPAANEKKAMKEFIKMVPLLIPCSSCQIHSLKYIKSKLYLIDWAVENKMNLFYFWWEFHNYVNKQLGKQELSFEKVKDLYQFNN